MHEYILCLSNLVAAFLNFKVNVPCTSSNFFFNGLYLKSCYFLISQNQRQSMKLFIFAINVSLQSKL